MRTRVSLLISALALIPDPAAPQLKERIARAYDDSVDKPIPR